MSRARELEERAALWVVRREEPEWSVEDDAALERWLQESDAHKAAFWRLEHGWRQADRIGALGGLAPPLRAVRPLRRWWMPVAAAACLALLFFGLAVQRVSSPPAIENIQMAKFETEVGGRKSINLPDGSRIELNTDSAIQAAVGTDGRHVVLDRGEAFFTVQRDPAREFTVQAGSRVVTVLGTRFSVRQSGADLIVKVLEGRVRIEDRSKAEASRSADLAAGDTALARADSLLVTSGTIGAVENQLAWRTGNLVFDGTTLEDAAAQFNRYNRKQLIIADPQAAATRIGGTFRTDNVEAFARLLSDAYGLQIKESSREIVVTG